MKQNKNLLSSRLTENRTMIKISFRVIRIYLTKRAVLRYQIKSSTKLGAKGKKRKNRHIFNMRTLQI